MSQPDMKLTLWTWDEAMSSRMYAWQCGVCGALVGNLALHEEHEARQRRPPRPYSPLGDPNEYCGRGGVCALGRGHQGRCRT